MEHGLSWTSRFYMYDTFGKEPKATFRSVTGLPSGILNLHYNAQCSILAELLKLYSSPFMPPKQIKTGNIFHHGCDSNVSK